MKSQYAKLPSTDTYDAAVVVAYVRVADRKGTVGLPDDQVEIINQLIAGSKPVIIAALGSPYLISRFPGAKTWLAVFGTQEGAQRAAARAIFGQIPIGGKIPVTVPGTAKRGDGIQLPANPMKLAPAPPNVDSQLQPAYKILDDAVAGQAFPGGVLAVGHNNVFTIHAFGRFTYDKSSRAVTPGTMYDLASITKPVATTTSIMLLSEDGRIDINLPVSRYLPEWPQAAPKDPDPTWRAKVTVRDLLLHDSGLPAHRDYYKQVDGYDKVLSLILAEPLIREPGTKVEYSDLGFILLGEIVHRLTGLDFDAYANDYIFEPLQMSHTTFLPAKSLRSSIPPTEVDKDYRNKLVQGEVHDQNASAMGGIAGHAGLFSTAGDLATFAQMMLNGGIYAHQRLLARPTINRFTTRVEIADSARALGWDVPTTPSSSGDFFSKRAYGHTGYTGTSLWIDPEKDLFVILLTNRTYPSTENNKIREVRPALHNAIVEGLGLVPTPAPTR